MGRRAWIAGIAIGTPMVLIAAVWIAGARLPAEHTASVTARLDVPPDDVWRAVTDLEHLPEWRSDVESVELARTDDGRAAWTEIDGWGGRMAFEVVSARFPDHFEVRMTDATQPFGGSWTWHLESDGTGSLVTITEDGYVRPAPLRAISKYVIGHDATMRQVMTDLAARFGQDVEFVP